MEGKGEEGRGGVRRGRKKGKGKRSSSSSAADKDQEKSSDILQTRVHAPD